MRLIPGFALVVFLGILAASVKLAVLFGMDYVLSSRATLALISAWALLLTGNGCIFLDHLTRRHSTLTPKTVAWILPVLHMASCYLLMFGTFFTLRWALGEDAWSLVTKLPTPFAIRIAGLLYLVTNVVILAGLVSLLVFYFLHRRVDDYFLDSDEVSTRRKVRRMSIGLILAIAVLTSVLVVAFPENIHFYMAALSARNPGQAAAAKTFFCAFLRKYPSNRLADSARMMASKVMIGTFSEFGEAEELLKQVVDRKGPLSDEAVFTLGRLYAFEMGQPDMGEAALRRFLRDFPRNPLADEALVTLADLMVNRGLTSEAVKCLDSALKMGDNTFFIMDTDWTVRETRTSSDVVAARRNRILHPGNGVL